MAGSCPTACAGSLPGSFKPSAGAAGGTLSHGTQILVIPAGDQPLWLIAFPEQMAQIFRPLSGGSAGRDALPQGVLCVIEGLNKILADVIGTTSVTMGAPKGMSTSGYRLMKGLFPWPICCSRGFTLEEFFTVVICRQLKG